MDTITKITCGVRRGATTNRFDAIVWGPTGMIGRGTGRTRDEAIAEATCDVERRGDAAASALARWLGYGPTAAEQAAEEKAHALRAVTQDIARAIAAGIARRPVQS